MNPLRPVIHYPLESAGNALRARGSWVDEHVASMRARTCFPTSVRIVNFFHTSVFPFCSSLCPLPFSLFESACDLPSCCVSRNRGSPKRCFLLASHGLEHHPKLRRSKASHLTSLNLWVNLESRFYMREDWVHVRYHLICFSTQINPRLEVEP